MLRVSVAIADPATVREWSATVLIKALSYDDKLLDRAGQEMVVAVLYRPGEEGATAEAEGWHRAFATLTSLRFRGLPFRAVKLPLGNAQRLRKAIQQQGIDALFGLEVTADDLVTIQKVARERKVSTLASREEQVTAGLSLGVFIIDGKNTLMVNLTAARAEGAVFSSTMLKLAKVIK
jgi:hypothetical protein